MYVAVMLSVLCSTPLTGSPTEKMYFPDIGEKACHAALSPDCREAAIAGLRQLVVWNTYGTRVFSDRCLDGESICGLRYSDTGRYLVIQTGESSYLIRDRDQGYKLVQTVTSRCHPASDCTGKVAVGCRSHRVDVLQGDKEYWTAYGAQMNECAEVVCFDPGGRQLAVAVSMEGAPDFGKVRLYNERGALKSVIETPHVRAMAFNASGNRLACADGKGLLSLYELPSTAFLGEWTMWTCGSLQHAEMGSVLLTPTGDIMTVHHACSLPHRFRIIGLLPQGQEHMQVLPTFFLQRSIPSSGIEVLGSSLQYFDPAREFSRRRIVSRDTIKSVGMVNRVIHYIALWPGPAKWWTVDVE